LLFVYNMSNIPASEQHSEKVNRLFSKIAGRYDIANDLQSFFLHRRWKKRVAKLSGINKDSVALDLCCGTGDIAFELVKYGARVFALDFSQMMLELAMKRWEEFKNACKIQRPCCSLSGRPTITYNVPGEIIFVKGDSLRLPFFDNSFDAITIGYGLRNLSDWKLAIAEMIRVAKPGGKIVILEFGKPELKLWRLIYFWYLKNIIPWLGKFTAGDFDAYYYIYESLMRYPGQFLVADEMSRAGCRNTQIINILGGAMTINYGEKS